MAIVSMVSLPIPSYVQPPRVLIRFRLLRDGESTAGEKFLRVYRSWADIGQLDLVFWAPPGEGEYSLFQSVDLATLQAIEWLVVGRDEALPRCARAAYLNFTAGGTYTFNITSPVDKPEGFGYLAGEFPDGITTRLDTPISATIKVMHTAADGRMGKVAEVVSNPDGTWAVHNLDPTKQFDVICSLEGFNDLVLSKVSPTPY